MGIINIRFNYFRFRCCKYPDHSFGVGYNYYYWNYPWSNTRYKICPLIVPDSPHKFSMSSKFRKFYRLNNMSIRYFLFFRSCIQFPKKMFLKSTMWLYKERPLVHTNILKLLEIHLVNNQRSAGQLLTQYLLGKIRNS